ncbi:MAG TPA: septation protein SepH [Kineosporiaceae bacterium]|nr:septation protein SepH [Kineosporiaceae bacterium]
MHDLTLVGVHDGGEHLVLAGHDGQRFLLPVDEPLRAAVRRDRARLAQLQIEQSGSVRPRDIQAKIRSGWTAEDVAAEAGVAVEHVRRFEGPVLAEREFIARQARGARLRRAAPGTPGSYPTLDELVAERLAAREVDPATTAWDAWRSDGTWYVRLTFEAGGRTRSAQWSYDVQLRQVSALDDEARWLLDEPAAEPEAVAVGARRTLAAVRDQRPGADGGVRELIYDVGADGGVRTAEDGRAGAAAATVDLLDTLRERRGRRQWLPDADEEADGLDPLERAVDQLRVRAEALGEPPAAHPPRSRPDQLEDAELLALPELPAGHSEQPAPAGPAPATTSRSAAAPASRSAPAQARPAPGSRPGASHRAPTDPLDLDAAGAADRTSPSRRPRRASVPSWDDIVFGSRRD